MIVPMVVALTALQASPASTWYGPAKVTFPVQFVGDPYDPDENNVEVQFTSKDGTVEKRIAYFDAATGSFQAILVGHKPGDYRAKLIRNGVDSPVADREGVIHLKTPMRHGFLHLDPSHKNRFVWDDGTPIAPIGFDLGWQINDILPMTDQIAKMAKGGVNWTRIWACYFDGRNPWWPSDHSKLDRRALWPPAIAKWDKLEQACETNSVEWQFTLFHHGEFSSQVNPNWNDNPWNTKNGGFLEKPGDFFTDPEAKARAKVWLRYAVARYAASPALFSWELFNEVQWVDPIHIDHRWTEVVAWHKEMADYLRSIDPYHHPVTSSSDFEPSFNQVLDYLQPHTYSNNVFASVLGTTMPDAKPGFYGEFGPGEMKGANFPRVIMDGLLGGLLANHAASGMFWYWDTVEKENLYSSFAIGRKVADLSHWAEHPGATLKPVTVHTKERSGFVFRPGMGWGRTTQSSYDLPEGANAAALGNLSSYIQGTANHSLMPEPLTLNFHLDRASEMKVEIGEISAGGAKILVTLDGAQVYQAAYKHDDHPDIITLALPTGTHKVEISNPGNDWFVLKSLMVSNLAPAADVTALCDDQWMLSRVTRNDHGQSPLVVDVSSVPLTDGVYDVSEIDLGSGEVKVERITVKDFEVHLVAKWADEMLVFSKPTG